MKNSLLVCLLLFSFVRGYSQCTLKVNLTSSSSAICSGSSVVLTATASAGTAPYSYAWSTGETTQTINVNKAGTYTVTVTDKTPGCQSVITPITITSAAVPDSPTALDMVACPNSPVTLTATAPGGTYQWYDALTGGNFLQSGATYATPPITATTTYYVQTTLNDCTSQRRPVNVTLINNPTVAGASVCFGNTASLRAGGSTVYEWYDVPTGGNVLATTALFITPPLTATTTYYVLSIVNGCRSARVPVTAIVTPPPQPPTASTLPICSGAVASLHASGTGILDWFTTPTGGTSLISSPDFTTPPLTATTTYYVQSTVNTCVSDRTPVTVTVNAIPDKPVIADMPVCSGGSAVLTAPAFGGTYNWYNAAAGGSLLATGNTFTTPVLTNSTTYYVEANNGGCTSQRSAVNVIVTPPPAQPSASGALICSGSFVILTATAPGGLYQWYDAPTAGNLLATAASYTTPALTTNTTYYVQTTVAGCASTRTPVTVNIFPPPVAPVSSGVSTCSGSVTTLSANAANGTYAWYDSAVGGNLLSVAQSYATPALTNTTTYYVQVTDNNGCTSTRTPVTVTITPLPASPTASGPPICPGTSATLTATGVVGTVQWYSAAAGGALLATGNIYNTPPLGGNTTYFVQQTVGTCTSLRTPVTVSMIAVASPQFQYSSGTFCTLAPNPKPVINNPAGGTFSSSPAGLVFVSTTTGQINIAASVPGNYTIAFSGKGVCPNTTTALVSIVVTPSATFSYGGSFCENGPVNPLPVFPAGSSAGVFTASGAGLVFLNTSTGEVDLKNSKAGTYTVTNAIPANGPCVSSSSTASITIDPIVVINAGPDQSVQSGTPVQLAGSITGGTTTGAWSGGAGSFSNSNLLNAIYTPGPGETSATLTLLSTDPPGPCGPRSDNMTITFLSAPTAPTAKGTSVCPGSVATLNATAPGGSYRWYDAPTGGNLLGSGALFTTQPISVNTTFYVQTTVAGLISSRTPVLVAVNPIPAAPSVLPVLPVCSGSTTTLTASGSTGIYQWYDAATGGNLLATGSSYITTFLTTNASYYVQAVVNDCPSARTRVDITISPIPAITSSSTGVVCSGNAQNYTITANDPAATFLWSRAAVAGITNPAVTNQASSAITETLINTTAAPINVTYVITATTGSCSGTPFSYVVIVNPALVVTSGVAPPICSGTGVNYAITFNAPGVSFNWSRAVVPGVSNASVSGQTASTIREVLFNSNTTNAPIDVTYVITYTAGGCSGTFNLIETVNPSVNVTSVNNGTACSGIAQAYTITSNVPGTTYSWSRAAVAGISNPSVTNQADDVITETLVNTTISPVRVNYIITPSSNGCTGPEFIHSVLVNPQPATPQANANSPVCTGSTINLQTPVIANVTYTWTGPNGFTSHSQNPSITNVTLANSGEYDLYVTSNTTACQSKISPVIVTVDPPPVVSAGTYLPVCHNATSVQLAGSVTVGAAAGTGIWSTSGTGTFSPANNFLNAQYIPSATDVAAGSVKLTLASTSKDDCAIQTDGATIVFVTPTITSKPTDGACTGVAQSYTITANTATANFTWSRAAVAGISNPAVGNQSNSTIDETLFNTTASAIPVVYTIIPFDNGCPGTPFTYTVTVYPSPVAPAVTSNSPVCVAGTIDLKTPTVANATYAWTGPNGFTSTDQNPSFASVDASAGTYTLVVTVNGCPSPSAPVNVIVDQQPVAVAGTVPPACPSTTSVPLSGTVNGGNGKGTWTTSGTGTFADANSPATQYFPSAQDIAAGSVTLTLASSNTDQCSISTSSLVVTFQLLPAVNAGGDQSICSQDAAALNGQIIIAGGGVWSTSGTGTFIPAADQLDARYVPSAADVKNGSVVLTLTANGAGQCYVPTDALTVKLIPPPTVNAGGTVYVLKNDQLTLNPTVSDNDVTYSWSPDVDISSTTVKNPVITGDIDRTYTLTVTDSRGCVASDQVFIKVSPEITIPNTFTPNGDGVNDLWNIKGLTAYQHSVIDIFDRYGQKIFHSVGYGQPWDGTNNGKPVPFGTYYYIIDTKMDGIILKGYIAVIR